MKVIVNKAAPVVTPPTTYDLVGLSADNMRFLTALIGNQCSPRSAVEFGLSKHAGEGLYKALLRARVI